MIRGEEARALFADQEEAARTLSMFSNCNVSLM